MHYATLEKPASKGYILYNLINMTFWKDGTKGTENRSTVARGRGRVRELTTKGIRGFFEVIVVNGFTTLYYSKTVNLRYINYTSVNPTLKKWYNDLPHIHASSPRFPILKNGITIQPFSKARNLAMILETSFSVTQPHPHLYQIHLQVPPILLLKHCKPIF